MSAPGTAKKIRVLVVEDSAVARALIVEILDRDPRMEVIATARDGQEALERFAEQQPDVVTMDIHMPRLDGYEATRRIMETSPVPVIVVSASADPADVRQAFRVMEAGAVAVLEKPRGLGDPRHAAMAAKLVQTVCAMSEVCMIRRWKRQPGAPEPSAHAAAPAASAAARIEIVAIGASTGGPPVLQTILAGLPADFPAPVLIVQHIAAGFVGGLAEWLARSSRLPIHLAEHGAAARPGHAYLAPDGHHLGVGKNARLSLAAAPAENGLRPAVSWLFRSVAENFGPRAAAILLTGMGVDGAAELKRLRERGALTLAQDRASSVVFGMPGEAVKIGAALHVLPPLRIVATLEAIVRGSRPAAAPRDRASA